jgi:hypothetical protein
MLIEKSPEKTVQAAALHSLATRILADKNASKERITEGRALMTKLTTEYAGVKTPKGADYKDLADAWFLETDHLQIGKEAPEFEATDENGAKWKLSDYRGKVVVLDFWGIW